MISGYIIGDKQLVARIGRASNYVKAEVDPTVRALGFRLQANVVTQKLSGQVLKRRTGRGAASIAQGSVDSRSRFETTAVSAFAYVGTNVSYMIGWELGFTRKVGAGARGGPRTLTGRSLESYIAKHPPGVKQVPARPFLQPSLVEMRPLIVAELGNALKRGMQAAMKS